jgi:lipoprotein-releasing system ATP-binding protein
MNKPIREIGAEPEKTPGSAPTQLKVTRPVAMNVTGLHKSYRKARHQLHVLKGVDLEINEGEFTAIVGQSGSGKSTLLHLLGTLDAPDAGEVWFDDQRIDNLPSRHLEQLRNQQFGMIFQFYHLLPELTMLENVLIPRMIQHGIWSYWRNRSQYRQRALKLLEIVGLSDRLHHFPRQLSGGEMQRTAIARALISGPSILFADEPTGNLDHENGEEVMKTLFDLQREENLTIVMVTHDDAIADRADQLIRLVDGRVEAA